MNLAQLSWGVLPWNRSKLKEALDGQRLLNEIVAVGGDVDEILDRAEAHVIRSIRHSQHSPHDSLSLSEALKMERSHLIHGPTPHGLTCDLCRAEHMAWFKTCCKEEAGKNE